MDVDINNYFINVANVTRVPFDSDFKIIKQFLNEEKYNINRPFKCESCTRSELEDAISNLKKSTFRDVSGIISSFVKRYKDQLINPLFERFNDSMESGQFPGILRKSREISIFKDGDRKQVNNFRPISILSIFSKLYERIMLKRLMTHTSNNNVINAQQFGFVEKSNT